MKTPPKVSSRELRRHLKEQDAAITDALVPSIDTLHRNEQLTRHRVERIEAIVAMPFWRLLWWCLVRR